MATPDFLGFAQAMPKQSPLSAAIGAGLETFEKVQDIKSKAQDMQAKAYLLKALPKDIDIAQQKGILENKFQEMKNNVGQMSIDQMHQTLADTELQKIYNMHINYPDHPEYAEKQYQLSRDKMISYGVSKDELPDKLNDEVLAKGHMNEMASPEASEYRKGMAELVKTELENQGKVDAAAAKHADKAQDAFDIQTSKSDAKYFSEQMPKDEGIAKDNLTAIKDYEHQLDAHSFILGDQMAPILNIPFASNILKSFSTGLNEALKDSKQLQVGTFQTTLGASRTGKSLLEAIGQMKVTPGDPKEAQQHKLKILKTNALYGIEYAKFARRMIDMGVHSKNQIDEAFGNYIDSLNIIDKKGEFHPELITTDGWVDFYKKYPKYLPSALIQKVNDSQKYGTATEASAHLPMAMNQVTQLREMFPNFQQPEKSPVIPTYTPTSTLNKNIWGA